MSYVRVIEPYSPSRSEPAAFFDMARVTTTYCDGLGRPVEMAETVRQVADSSPRTTASASTTHCSCASPRRSASLSQRTKWIEKWCRELSCACGCAAKLWCVSI